MLTIVNKFKLIFKVKVKTWHQAIKILLKKLIINRLSAARQFEQVKLAQKIIIGASETSYPGWLSTDKDSLDVVKRDNFAQYWKPGSRLAFLAEHVWEHLSSHDAEKAISNCFEFLKPGGRLRLAVPDGFHPDPAYIESVRPHGKGAGAEEHKVLYNYNLLTDNLVNTGFQVELLEYWDENGQFHFQEWSSEEGHIRRSKRYDPRNQDGTLSYTSLIVDAIKP